MKEARIVINGIELNDAQSIAVRCAITSFRMELMDPEALEALGPIGPLYDERLKEVEAIIFSK